MDSRVFHLRRMDADELVRFSFKEIEPRNHRAVGASGECRDVLGRQDCVASEALEDFNVANDVRPYGYDLAVAPDWLG